MTRLETIVVSSTLFLITSFFLWGGFKYYVIPKKRYAEQLENMKASQEIVKALIRDGRITPHDGDYYIVDLEKKEVQVRSENR